MRKGGREIDRVVRPLRHTVAGAAVVYRRQLWKLDASAIDLDTSPLEMTLLEDPAIVIPVDRSEQDAVINAPADARIVVDAGPGTGKTHAACLRVASLIEQGMNPARIWMISFTRTAILEIRNRIGQVLSDPAAAASVRVATLDSHAWAIQSGFSTEAALTGSFDESIEQTLERLRSDEEVGEYLQCVMHVVVDEAQDIVGPRADLVAALIEKLSDEAGVTVFCDPAQAIYGFTEDEARSGGELSLPARLEAAGFQAASLTQVRRTDCPRLRSVFTDVRQKVLNRHVPAGVKSKAVRDDIRRLAHADAGQARELDLAKIGDGGLVLMRRRMDVLVASSFGADVPHRLRMSGLPACVFPWLGRMLWDWTDRLLPEGRFADLWTSRSGLPAEAADAAWQLLVEAAGEDHDLVDLHRLRRHLARTNPPVLFCSPEFGERGPILSTIHASKGREADEVALFLPPPDDGEDDDEETRVIFVGATRARRRLAVGETTGRRSGSRHGRCWRRARGKVQVEIGRAGDLRAEGLVGRSAFAIADGALAAQALIAGNPVCTGLRARADRSLGWQFSLETADRVRLAVLSAGMKADLEGIAGDIGAWPPPDYLPFLRSMGLRTIVVRPDDPVLEQLHEPWRTSGFLLAPLLAGLSPGKFGK